MRSIFLLLFVITGIFCIRLPYNNKLPTTRQELKRIEDRLVTGFRKYAQNEKVGLSQDVEEALELVRAPKIFRRMGTTSQPTICLLCKVAARLLILYRKTEIPHSETKIKALLTKLCVTAEIETENVCKGVIELNAPIFLYIIDNKPDLTVDTICSTIVQPYNCLAPPEDGNWSVSLPPRLRHSSKRTQTAKKEEILDERPIKILQLTDIHYDELYAPGSNAECGEPLCCGTNQGKPKKPEDAAGNWGDYRSCDMPWYTVLDLLDQVKNHEFDYVYHTGDIINHRVWATSLSNNVKNIKKLYAELKNVFDDTPVYSILGNHEPNPLNEYAQRNITQPDLTTQWLYDLVSEEWSFWLPEETQDSIKKGGYYTTLVRPGFRIIALNSNVAYTFNWWLLYDQSMLEEQLQWLSDVLSEAEKNEEIVHILSHVPSGDSTCLIKWSQEYKRIIQRFSHIITAQFVGHTHYDEMNLFFNNPDINDPISVAYNGGSFTTFINVNPNYVIYEVNPKTLEVENYEQWIYNVTEANLNSLDVHPRWYKLYSFKEAFGLKSMKLSELSNLVQNMATNQTLLDQYYRFKMRDGDLAMIEGCNDKCHEENLCNLVTTQFGDHQICNEMLDKYREAKK